MGRTLISAMNDRQAPVHLYWEEIMNYIKESVLQNTIFHDGNDG